MRTIILSLLLLVPGLALARDMSDMEYIGAYAGYYDITQQDNEAPLFGLEYRYKDIFYGLRPNTGVMVTGDEAVYGHVGFAWDIFLTDNLILTPNLAVGAYTQGDGKDLGHAIEFRDGIELTYQFDEGDRLSLHFNHMSNAGIGDDNPGTEILFVMYQIPMSFLSEGNQAPRRARLSPASNQPRWWR